MRHRDTGIEGLVVVDLEPHVDDRGGFARAYCQRELAGIGFGETVRQANLSWNTRRGTLRGIHLQGRPHEECKLVRCIAGRVYDVAVDLRPGSPTIYSWFGIELSAENGRMLCIPPGCGHAYLTLEDRSAVHYLVTAEYAPGSEWGVRYDDPRIGISWPAPVQHVSAKDLAWQPIEV